MLLWAVGATIATAVAYWYAPARAHRRRLRDAELCPIASFPHGGTRRIAGRLKLQGDYVLIAPISGRKCAAYEVLVQGLDSHSKEKWDTVAYEVQAVPFVIEDATGRAHIDPARAKLLVTLDQHQFSGTTKRMSPQAEAFLRRHGQGTSPWAVQRPLRFREGVLEPNELVTALGPGRVSIDDDIETPHTGGYRTPAGARKVEIAAGDRGQLLISDDPSVVG